MVRLFKLINLQLFSLSTVVAPKINSLSRRLTEWPTMFLLGMLDNIWSHLVPVDRISLSPTPEMIMATAGLQKNMLGVAGWYLPPVHSKTGVRSET